ncbi:MAG: SRPBCC family protein [Leucobacter sp.]
MSTGTTTPEFTINRVIAASRERVWQGWTRREEFAQWLHPFGVRLDEVFFDIRVGGDYRYTMVNEETGEQFPTGGTFFEIEEPLRLVFSWGEPGATVDSAAVISVTLRDAPGESGGAGADGESDAATALEFHLRGFEGHAGDNFVYDGWMEALDNFERHLRGELRS